MTLDQIITSAQALDAVGFERFLEEHKISNTWLDVCITDYNKGWFNITLDSYDDVDIAYYDGVYCA